MHVRVVCMICAFSPPKSKEKIFLHFLNNYIFIIEFIIIYAYF